MINRKLVFTALLVAALAVPSAHACETGADSALSALDESEPPSKCYEDHAAPLRWVSNTEHRERENAALNRDVAEVMRLARDHTVARSHAAGGSRAAAFESANQTVRDIRDIEADRLAASWQTAAEYVRYRSVESSVASDSLEGGISGVHGAATRYNGNEFDTVEADSLPSDDGPYSLHLWFRADQEQKGGLIGYGAANERRSNAIRIIEEGSPEKIAVRHYWWGSDLDTTSDVPYDRDGDGRGDWHHLVATYDGDTRSVWIDGERVAQDTPGVHRAYPRRLRVARDVTNARFNGSIDEARVYDRALARSEIQLLYHYGRNETEYVSGRIEIDGDLVSNQSRWLARSRSIDESASTVVRNTPGFVDDVYDRDLESPDLENSSRRVLELANSTNDHHDLPRRSVQLLLNGMSVPDPHRVGTMQVDTPQGEVRGVIGATRSPATWTTEDYHTDDLGEVVILTPDGGSVRPDGQITVSQITHDNGSSINDIDSFDFADLDPGIRIEQHEKTLDVRDRRVAPPGENDYTDIGAKPLKAAVGSISVLLSLIVVLLRKR